MTTVTIEHDVAISTHVSPRVCETSALFGLSVDDEARLTIVPRCRVPLPAPGLVFVTGPSGSGKSTVLRCVADAARDAGRTVLALGATDEQRDAGTPGRPGETETAMADRALVDWFDLPLDRTHRLLAAAGLGEATVLLRTPDQLSDGQRYRFAIARLLFEADQIISPRGGSGGGSAVLLADEFCATLDRTTARNLAASVRRWIDRTPHTLLCATTHDDLLEALSPDVLVYKPHGATVEILRRPT